jgi:hypothetical protein
MTLGIGANTIFGHGQESTYGTAVTVDRFHEFLDENLKRNSKPIQSMAIRGGLRQAALGARRAITNWDAGGSVKFEIGTNSYGRLLKHLMGTVVTTTPNAGVYLHTFTPGSTQGLSLTLQKQIRDAANSAVSTFTYPGSKVASMEFNTQVGQLLQATADFDCRDEVTNIAAASASFVSQTLYNFQQSSLTIGGSASTDSTSASIKIENPLKKDRWFLGGGGLKAEQLPNNFLKVTGKITAEFQNQAEFYDRFVADSGVTLVLAFTGPTIASTFHSSLTFTCQDIRFTGDTPQVKGVDVVMTDCAFEATWDGTNPTVSIAYQTSDTLP